MRAQAAPLTIPLPSSAWLGGTPSYDAIHSCLLTHSDKTDTQQLYSTAAAQKLALPQGCSATSATRQQPTQTSLWGKTTCKNASNLRREGDTLENTRQQYYSTFQERSPSAQRPNRKQSIIRAQTERNTKQRDKTSNSVPAEPAPDLNAALQQHALSLLSPLRR